MGAFGPKRVITADDQHTPAAPYRLANNDYSLLDATDLVFIDAPGTGFSRLLAVEKDKDKKDKKMQDRRKEFYGVDQDGEAFAQFITKFLSQYGRWNSPKYLFGESYGTTRSAVLANKLETEQSVDLNGIILLSQILCFSNDIDAPQFNPGVDQAYALALPTYAATAWYHHRVPGNPERTQAVPRASRTVCDERLSRRTRGRRTLDRGAQTRGRAKNCTSSPDCRSTTSKKRTCASMAVNSRRPCRTRMA